MNNKAKIHALVQSGVSRTIALCYIENMDEKSINAQINAQITNRAEIKLADGQVTCHGSYHLIEKVNQYKKQFGSDFTQWPVQQPVRDSIDILINEIILKAQNQNLMTYQQEELCHCRTVSTETVVQSVKQNCRTVKEISRATKAGTGCGTCIPQLKLLLSEILGQEI